MNYFLTSGVFLTGLTALAVPLVLHWLNRKPRRETKFPALTFLLRSTKNPARTSNWRRWLILAMRCLAIALLCYAFCRPYLSTLSEKPKQAQLLVWDDSFSMTHEPELSMLKQQLTTELNRCSPDLPMALGLAQGNTVRWSGPFTGNAAELLDFFRANAHNVSTTNFADLPRQADLRFAELPGAESTLHLFTDAQKLPWLRVPNDARFERTGRFLTHRPAPRPVANAAVAGAELHRGDTSVSLRARLVNHAGRAVTGHLKLVLNGQELHREPIELAAGETRETALGVPAASGDLSGMVEFDCDDEIAADNRWFFSRAADDAPTRAPDAARNDFNFPALAVGVSTELTALPAEPAGKLLIWQDPAALTPERQKQLTGFLKAGGTLALTLDATPRTAGYLAEFGVKMNPTRAEETQLRKFDVFDFDHPVFKRLFEVDGAGWGDVLIYRSVKVTPPPEARVAITFDNGAPAALELPVGAGRLWLFMLQFSASDTSWAGHYSFLPFWRELEKYAASSRTSGLRAPGEVLRLTEQTAAEFDDGTGFRPLPPVASGFLRFERPGNYRVNGKLYSVNVPGAESVYQPDAIDRKSRIAVAPPVPAAIPATGNDEPPPGENNELFRWFLATALFCCLGELWLANRTAL